MAERTTTTYDNGDAVNKGDDLGGILAQIASNTKAVASGEAGDATAANQTTGNTTAAAILAQGNTTTQVSAAKVAGESVVIPALAKEWTVSVWTGTCTINGAAGCPAGFSDGSTKANAATITITFATPGTGYVRYGM